MDLIGFINAYNLQAWVYLVLFFWMFLEATSTILVGTFLLAQGLFNPIGIVAAIVLGAYLEQLFMFEVGRRLSSVNILGKLVNKMAHRYDDKILKHPGQSFAVSKFVYGMHRVVLMRAGMLNMRYRKFLLASLYATGFWLIVIGSLGFSFGQSYKVLNENIGFAELIFLGFIIVFFISQYFVSKYLKNDI